jgi:hypothetical protein
MSFDYSYSSQYTIEVLSGLFRSYLIISIRHSIMSNRDLSLMVKYETFNLCYVGSNPAGLKLFIISKEVYSNSDYI